MNKDRIKSLLEAMCKGAFEREETIALSLLSSLAGESIFLLGLPGVGKSMIARRLKMAFKNSTGFEYLMSRFSTPDEIFGPVSISKLKDQDTYERIIDGYLPTADVVFLDEIWKAGPAIQNSLLTVLNEKVYRNGEKEIKLPLKAVIAASNELPTEGEGLEALWDRFLIRYVVKPIKDKYKFLSLLIDSPEECTVPEELKISEEEFNDIRIGSRRIIVPHEIGELIFSIRTTLEYARENENVPVDITESDLVEPPYVSDRRWKKIMGLMRTSAFLNGRDRVDLSDALLIIHTLWDNDDQIYSVIKLVAENLAANYKRYQADIYGNKIGGERHTRSIGELLSPDGENYTFMAGDEEVFVNKQDYDRLKSGQFRYGVMTDDSKLLIQDEATGLRIRKTIDGIAINSFSYALKRDSKIRSGSIDDMMAGVKKEMKHLEEDFASLINDNIFLNSYDSYPFLHHAFDKMKKKTIKKGY